MHTLLCAVIAMHIDVMHIDVSDHADANTVSAPCQLHGHQRLHGHHCRHTNRSEGNLNEEEREHCVKNMFAEFLSTHDVKEALTRAKELLVDGYGPTLVELGVEKLLDTPKEKEQSLLCKLLVQLAKIGTVTSEAFVQGYAVWSKQLEDIRCGWLCGVRACAKPAAEAVHCAYTVHDDA